jgi:outer membrane protein assembly factor BamB
MFCLDSRTGKPLWTTSVSKGNVNSTALVVEDRVIAATNDASVVAVDAMTGGLVWRTEIDGPSIHQVLSHAGAALIQTESLWWLGPEDGAVLGRWTRPREAVESLTTAGDLLVVLLRQEVLVGFRGHEEIYHGESGLLRRHPVLFSREWLYLRRR